ncbi:MAG: ribosome-associated translation inhibitor RaiA [Planctomycetia bacterium]|nr:ribosome-associated translation inhibitor RaiA [Planctomycetia bacterium]
MASLGGVLQAAAWHSTFLRATANEKVSREMQISISVRHGSITDENREKIEAKIGKLQRFLDRISVVEVTVDLESRENPAVDIRLTTDHKKSFVAQSQIGELFASLDDGIHKLEQQIKKFKEKLYDKRPE